MVDDLVLERGPLDLLTLCYRLKLVLVLHYFEHEDKVMELIDPLEADIVRSIGKNYNLYSAIDSIRCAYHKSDYEESLPRNAFDLISKLRSDRIGNSIEIRRQQRLLGKLIRQKTVHPDEVEIDALLAEVDFLILENTSKYGNRDWKVVEMRFRRITYEWDSKRTPDCINQLK